MSHRYCDSLAIFDLLIWNLHFSCLHLTESPQSVAADDLQVCSRHLLSAMFLLNTPLCSAAAPSNSLEQHAVQHTGGCSRQEEWSPHHCPFCAGNRHSNYTHIESVENLNSAWNQLDSKATLSERFRNLVKKKTFDWCLNCHRLQQLVKLSYMQNHFHLLEMAFSRRL